MGMFSSWSPDHAGIRPLASGERTYGVFDLFWNWFGDSANASSWYFGGLLAMMGVPFLLWNTFFWTPLIILPWALLALISFRTGATTVVLARPALGFAGGTLFLGISETLVQIGWTTVTTYIGAASLVQLWQGGKTAGITQAPEKGPLVAAILLIAVAQGVVASRGHGAIKILKWISSILLLLFGGVETYHVLSRFSLSSVLSSPRHASLLTGPQLLDISFTNIWTWLQVGDFARFSKTERGATLGSWLGLWSGQAWFALVGAVGVIGLGLETGHLNPDDSDPSHLMSRLGLSGVALSVIFLSCISVSTSNLYGAGMAFLSLLDRSKRKMDPGKALATVSLVQIGTAFIPLLFSSFIDYFIGFLTAIGGVFIPLWSLVLADFLVLRKRRVDADGLFDPTPKGTYWSSGGFNRAGFLALAMGIAFYYGVPHLFPLVSTTVGISLPAIGWTSGLYLLLARLMRDPCVGVLPRGSHD